MKRITNLSTLFLFTVVLIACIGTTKINTIREFSFLTSDSIQVYGDQYEHSKESPTIILFHQARSNARGEYRTIIPELRKQGYNIIAVDQRSGGQLFGSYNRTVAGINLNRPTYCDAYPDMEGALDYLATTGFSGPVIVWGSSYSAAMVIKLASEHSDAIDGVLAFSPASGEAMGACQPNQYFATLQMPLLVLRPESEMEYDSVKDQLELAQQNNHQVYIAKDGVHGSSMLVAERTKSNVENTWEIVQTFIKDVVAK